MSGLAAHFFLGQFMSLIGRITEVIEPVVEHAGYELVHLELLGNRRNAVLRVYIDKPGGVTVDDCASVSHWVSVVLDVEDPIPHSYTLEVSSPGVERGLYKRSDYRRFAGQPVKIEMWEPRDGRRRFTGELLGLGDDDLVTVRERELKKDVAVPYDQIKKAHLIFDWKKV
jgi:ribosome maturation factor RimP